MYKCKKILSIILALLLSALVLNSCDSAENSSESGGKNGTSAQSDRLTYYMVKDFYVDNWIELYNKYCTDPDYRIETVEFDSFEELADKLSTELMSGGGPDIITSSVLSMAGLSVEKLLETDTFADWNELIKNDGSDTRLDLGDYNENAMEACVYNGKRFAVPLYFVPRIMISVKSKYDKYIGRSDGKITFEDIIEAETKLRQSNADTKLYSYNELSKRSEIESAIIDYIDGNIDILGKTMSFDKPEFKKTVTGLKELMLADDEESNTQITESRGALNLNCVIIDDYSENSPYWILSDMTRIESLGETPLIVNSPSADGELRGYISDMVFLNNNSDKKDKALKMIKDMLSEKQQTEMTGAKITEFDPIYENSDGTLFPVNNAAYKHLIKNAEEMQYNTADDYVGESERGEDYDLGKTEVSDYSKDLFEKMLGGIEKFDIDDQYYYNVNIVQSLVDDYLDGKISVDRFISELKSKTNIYLNE